MYEVECPPWYAIGVEVARRTKTMCGVPTAQRRFRANKTYRTASSFVHFFARLGYVSHTTRATCDWGNVTCVPALHNNFIILLIKMLWPLCSNGKSSQLKG